MPASKVNYIVVYRGESQIYGSASKEIALKTPPPPGATLEDKRILFVTYQPDNEVISVHLLPQEEVLAADITIKKKKEEEVND